MNPAADVALVLADIRARRASSTGLELLALLALRSRGSTLSEAVLAELAGQLGLERSHLDRIKVWAEALALEAGQGDAFASCHGTSCTLRGAESLAREVRGLLQESGAECSGLRLLCFGQCDHGPTWRCGTELYLAGERAVREDPRPWKRSGEERNCPGT